MSPTPRLLRFAAIWLLLAVPATLHPWPLGAWAVAGVLLLAAAVTDAASLRARPALSVERDAPDSIAQNTWTSVRLRLQSDAGAPIHAEIFDGVPREADTRGLPSEVDVPSDGYAELTYHLRLRERGEKRFAPSEVRRTSPLRLWLLRERLGAEGSVRVYPNFAPIARYALLAMENRQSAMGIRRRARRGDGSSFHQLREYREGDLLRQVDWKATSRRLQLISREYEEERDQRLLFLLDCGRRMRSTDGELDHFDHCLNATLLVSYVALKQGDSVGMLTFGGSDRWLPPVKGPGAMSTLLHHVYDLDTSTSPSDFEEAAARVIARERRRALVVILTNLRDVDDRELTPAVRTLRRRHIVVVASLRERHLDEFREDSVRDLDGALRHTSAALYLENRQRTIERLRASDVRAIDVRADELPVALTNQYLDIKQAGRL